MEQIKDSLEKFNSKSGKLQQISPRLESEDIINWFLCSFS
jgi:hypothetical protein